MSPSSLASHNFFLRTDLILPVLQHFFVSLHTLFATVQIWESWYFFSMALFFYIAKNTLQHFCEILTLIQCTFICAIKLKLVVTLVSL